jgi:hypothetical protein
LASDDPDMAGPIISDAMVIGRNGLLQAQSAATSLSVVQKSVNTGGGFGESITRWVSRIPVSCACGSEYQDVP